MRLLLHDLEQEEFDRIFPSLPQDIRVVSKGSKSIQKCVGCFKCWTKTPGECVISDGFGSYGFVMGECEEYIILSRIVYGSYSPFVKNVLDRNINYIMPFFEVRNAEQHHVSRYKKQILFTVIGYGAQLEKEEKATFRSLVRANAVNFNAKKERLFLVARPEDMSSVKEVWG